ncbi:FHA domain-containing protein [Corallococcus coralloides]|uniref:FHA domain-containing protein n=1 Tax=Corallococcus coralloides TaxID=184914 RepID=A0A410RLM8_CORCK|nr:FHA domain-containing protein [Corallococcus coralloides]QAT82837.1 FHA domain-containing protein [Corallococcus coralloides]
MAFQLTISEGKDAGKEFVFDQDSVLIGRTSECDVVLYDPGISRRHCRIFKDGDGYAVEDQKSANGTVVNGAAVQKQTLADGDTLTLGPVTFLFAIAAEDAPTGEDEKPAEDGANSTRIVSIDSVRKSRNKKGAALVPEGADEEDLQGIRAESTRMNMRAIRRPTSNAQRAIPQEPPPEEDAPAAIEKPAPAAPPARRTGSQSSRAVARTPRAGGASGSGGGLSAAERARIRRETPGLVANLRLFWAEANSKVRAGVMAGGGVVVLGLFALMYWLVLGGDTQVQKGEEPVRLSNQPINDSFGLGDGVTWNRPDMKVFEWEFVAATRAVVILHYQAQGISKDEVVVSVNGVDVGKVPPDTLASQERSLELMIPPQQLRKGEPNRIIFDNTRNPPGEDTWRVWNVWVERALLPEQLTTQQLVSNANDLFKKGRKNFDTPDIGARNRYEAWKSFREAWLMLEAHPDPKPDLYFEAQEAMRRAQQELDRTCSKLLLEVEGYYNQGHYKQAASTLDHMREYFPEYDQPCATRAENKRVEFGL